MNQILIIDNNKDSQLNTQKALGDEQNYYCVNNLKEAYLKLEKETFDAIILDPKLQNESGFDLFLKLKDFSLNSEVPIIIITEDDNIAELAHAFTLGAEDYIQRPFNPLEFRARVEARITKYRRKTNFLKINGLVIEPNFQKVFKEGAKDKKDLDLTPIEFKILFALIQSKGKPLKRADLTEMLWDKDHQFDSRGIDAHISNLRKKLGTHSKMIASVYGIGYAFRPPISSDRSNNMY